jgi:hypothetical protein
LIKASTTSLVAALALAACADDDARRDQYYGTDVGLDYTPPEAGVGAAVGRRDGSATARDASASSDAGVAAAQAAEAGGSARPDGGSGTSASCMACEQRHAASGQCRTSGCGALAGADRRLCEALLACMRSTGCWTRDPASCLCGTAAGLACATDQANGPCLSEAQQATKTRDPLMTSTVFNSLSVPAGHATQLIACDLRFCAVECGASSAPTDAGGH